MKIIQESSYPTLYSSSAPWTAASAAALQSALQMMMMIQFPIWYWFFHTTTPLYAV